MLFNSTEFFFFFFAIYLVVLVSKHRVQNVVLLIASYFFYGYWNWKFTGLLLLSTVLDYTLALRVQAANEAGRTVAARRWMWLAISGNLIILGVFKYAGFFTEILNSISLWLTNAPQFTTWSLILPAGISFYTFQSMCYTIDVWKGRIRAISNFWDFALYVSFFPQLMAGPIERAKKLLPAIVNPRRINVAQVRHGAWLLYWGLFKKVYIADNLAPYTAWSLTLPTSATGLDGWLGIIAFSTRYYCDFSGYSDMAVGLGKMLGVELTQNFKLPFFASNPSELWKRWHITLSNWFRDYVYGPLRGRCGAAMSLFLTMLLIGLWHGGAWNFVFFGGGWGIILIVHRVIAARVDFRGTRWLKPWAFSGWLTTIILWFIMCEFFVARDLPHAGSLLRRLFAGGLHPSSYSGRDALTLFYFTWPLLAMEIPQWRKGDIHFFRKCPTWLRWPVYLVMCLLLILEGGKSVEEFLYFRF